MSLLRLKNALSEEQLENKKDPFGVVKHCHGT
jgi:hypothetical protein